MSHYQIARIVIQHLTRIPHFRKYDEEINTYSLPTSTGKIYPPKRNGQSKATMSCNKLETIN